MSRLLAASLLALSCAVTASAQFDSGQIAGFVRDPARLAIVGVNVTATNEANGETRRTTTNESGYYVFPSLLVGKYTITSETAGFKKSIQTGIELTSANRMGVDVDMAVGAVSESVEVVATTTAVQAETAALGRTIERRQILDLTLNGRNPIYLALLKPGVTGGSIGTFAPDSVDNGNFTINGGRGEDYLVTVDGAVANRVRGYKSLGAMLGAQNVDTIQEVQILTANFNAEYGRASAGQIRFVTKGGTQRFHGDLVENFRNSALDANTWTRNHSPNFSESSRPAPMRFNQFGFDIGGPVFVPGKFNINKSKLFFFYAEEWLRRRAQATPTATVPTAAMKNGDLSELLNPANAIFRRARVVT